MAFILGMMQGLSRTEVAKRQQQYGKNEIRERSESVLIRILKKFIGPIPLMIELALLLSVFAGSWADFVVIAVLLVVNIALDVLQEQKARAALMALKKTLSPTARVVRDGSLKIVAAAELVPGDIIKLAIGDVVPADAVLLDDAFLQVDQSSVTGESLPVEKKAGDTIFVSSVIHTGAAAAKVTATGRNSSLGNNARLVARAAREKESHFQRAILDIGKFLIALSAILIIIVLGVLVARGGTLLMSMQFALVLAIASIPVALPAVLSVTMAIGAATLAKRRTIVSHFQSVEELASVDELCVDKTGTLTKNELAVTSPATYGDFDESLLFTYALLATDEVQTSVTKQAIDTYAKKQGFAGLVANYTKVAFTPFDPSRKMSTATLRDSSGGTFTVYLGAPQVLRTRFKDGRWNDVVRRDVEQCAQNGFRVIAVAREDQHGTVPVGIIPLTDPPREDARAVVAAMKEKGVRVRMLTGDNAAIAAFVARMLGIDGHVTSDGAVYNLQQTTTPAAIAKMAVFAEVVPEDKYRIVQTLQAGGHIVAMTGDGVNDAPALKKADVGIAVSEASPAARAAADIILLDKGLSVIQDAIYYARMTFARMQAYALFRISETVRVVFFITLAILVFNYAPLSAIMIILLALLNDIPVMSIAYDNAPVHEKPMRWHMRDTIFISALLGTAGVISSFALLYWLHVSGVALATIQTIIFLKLDVAGHSTLYLTRTGRKHFWQRPFPSLKFFIPAFSSRLAGTLIAVFGIFMQPISWQTVAYVWLYAVVWFFVNDQIKVLGYRVLNRLERRHLHPSMPIAAKELS